MVSGIPPVEPAPVEIRLLIIPERMVHSLGWTVVLLSAAGLAVVILRTLGYPSLLGLARLFDLSLENNLPSWFSSAMLFLAAQTLFVIFIASRQNRDPDSRSWAVFAVLLAFMSLDETASIHELVSNHLVTLLKSERGMVYPWVFAGAAFVVTLALAARGFLSRLPRIVRRRIMAAAIVFFTGCLGLEAIQGRMAAVVPDWRFLRHSLGVVEETLEMAGAVLFLRALLAHLSTLMSAVKIELRDSR